ncbi:hypothetical protein KJ761_03660 [Patescibacteria group bacterium]|nr:hypothetical protein [Patescibacteria group bacterium]
MTPLVSRESDIEKAVSMYVATKAGRNLDLQIEAMYKLFETIFGYLDRGGSVENLERVLENQMV